MQAANLDCGR